MLAWQYRTALAELQQVQLHMADPSCPCSLGNLNEWCVPKHLLSVASLAQETAAMDSPNFDLWYELGQEATSKHEAARQVLCHQADSVELLDWCRSWRKRIEPLYYGCGQAGQDWQHPDHTVLGEIERQIATMGQPATVPRGERRRLRYQLTEPVHILRAGDPPGVVPPEFQHLRVDTRLVRDPEWLPEAAPVITSPESAQPFFRLMREADREWLMAILVDTRKQVVGLHVVNIGIRSYSIVAVDAVLRAGILANASGIILAHNHPSGDPTPSEDDRKLLRLIKERCPAAGIDILDMIVVGQVTDYTITGEHRLRAPADHPFTVVPPHEPREPVEELRPPELQPRLLQRVPRVIWAEEFLDIGGTFNPDGTVDLYHATTKEKATQILIEGFLRRPADAPDTYGVYLSSSPDVAYDYGDGTLLKVRVRAEDLHLDDAFPGRRLDFFVPTVRGIYRPVSIEAWEPASYERSPRDRIAWQDMTEPQIDALWGWKPFREILLSAVARQASVTVQPTGLLGDQVQLTIGTAGLAGFEREELARAVDRLLPTAKRVYAFGELDLIYIVTLPIREVTPEELIGRPQPIPERPIRPEPGLQPALFQPVISPPVPDPWGSRCRDPMTGQWTISELCPPVPTDPWTPEGHELTWAVGPISPRRFDLVYRAVEARDVIPSHDPFSFEPDRRFPAELQPRLRERKAPRVQVERIAAILDPGLLLEEYHALDRGAPIVGPDMVVESGNGRVMAVIRSRVEHPEVYRNYKEYLLRIAPRYGLDAATIQSMETPVLVRERLTEVVRTDFVAEANATSSISRSTVEIARSDAKLVTTAMLDALEVLEGEGIEDAIRAPRNRRFVGRFLDQLGHEERAALLDAAGDVNQDGVRRIATAIFVRTFEAGDVGLTLAERWFESTEPDVKQVFNGIARSLGPLARMEAMCAANEREPALSIADDLAQVITVYSKLRKLGMRVEDYLAQLQLEVRELNELQEQILIGLHDRRRSAKRIGELLGTYSDLVIASPPPGQITMIALEPPDKAALWAEAMRRTERLPDPELELVPVAQVPRSVRLRQVWGDMGARALGGLAGGFGVAIGAKLAARFVGHLISPPPEPAPLEEYVAIDVGQSYHDVVTLLTEVARAGGGVEATDIPARADRLISKLREQGRLLAVDRDAVCSLVLETEGTWRRHGMLADLATYLLRREASFERAGDWMKARRLRYARETLEALNCGPQLTLFGA